MGKTKKAQKRGSRFLELKSSIIERLQRIHELMREETDRNKNSFNVASSNNPKEIIARQAGIREEIRQASDDWKELDGIYKNEAKKRKSKFSQEDLELQHVLVQRLYAQIDSVKESQMKGYAPGAGEDLAANLNLKALAALDTTQFGTSSTGESVGGNTVFASHGSGVEVTSGQQMQIQELQDRDADFERQLDDIGEGIHDLSEIAQVQAEEVRRQNVMLESVGKKIDDAHDHMTNVNAKMKETLNEVRKADRICVDIMCIVMMVGLGAVLYSFMK